MYARALFDIIHTSGNAVLQWLQGIEGGADELFASVNTRAAVQDQLFTVANTLAHLPPVVMLQLPQVDWAGWAAVHQALQRPEIDQRDLLWYGASSLLPATLVLLDQLRAQAPQWFEIHY